jgi:hypothetical protein
MTRHHPRIKIQVDKFNGQHYEICARTAEGALCAYDLEGCLSLAGGSAHDNTVGRAPLQSCVGINILAALPPYDNAKELRGHLKERYAAKKQAYRLLSSSDQAKNK